MTNARNADEQEGPILPTWIANQNTGFTDFTLLTHGLGHTTIQIIN